LLSSLAPHAAPLRILLERESAVVAPQADNRIV
jgi:hypothetical protein